MNLLESLRLELRSVATPVDKRKGIFFKTGLGDYAEHDQFLGVSVPQLRKLAKSYSLLSMNDVVELLQSPVNEERLLALLILIERFQKGDGPSQKMIYGLYQAHIKHVNNWNLVDASAHLIVGAHLYPQDKTPLLALVNSEVLWERRIAMVATWYFIRQNDFDWTIKLSERLLHDRHDLMHKAVGWMLREVGKRNNVVLIKFLDQYADLMPRTMLRYAIERFPEVQRRDYLRPIHLKNGILRQN